MRMVQPSKVVAWKIAMSASTTESKLVMPQFW